MYWEKNEAPGFLKLTYNERLWAVAIIYVKYVFCLKVFMNSLVVFVMYALNLYKSEMETCLISNCEWGEYLKP